MVLHFALCFLPLFGCSLFSLALLRTGYVRMRLFKQSKHVCGITNYRKIFQLSFRIIHLLCRVWAHMWSEIKNEMNFFWENNFWSKIFEWWNALNMKESHKVSTEMIFHENISRLSTQIKFENSKKKTLFFFGFCYSIYLTFWENKNYFLILLFKRVGKQKHTINRFTLRWFSRFH